MIKIKEINIEIVRDKYLLFVFVEDTGMMMLLVSVSAALVVSQI